MNEWYLDDVSICGPIKDVIHDINRIVLLSEAVGLHLNPGKCEVIRIKPLNDGEVTMIPSTEEICLLGVQLKRNAISKMKHLLRQTPC